MDAFAAWVRVCDWLLAVCTEGMMHDDFPDYDWRACFDWGDPPANAVSGVVYKHGDLW